MRRRVPSPRLTQLLAAGALGLVAAGSGAQLRVLRVTPTGDSASPGNLITITFDRPVAGGLDRTVEAATIFTITPAVAGTVEWRDSITLRLGNRDVTLLELANAYRALVNRGRPDPNLRVQWFVDGKPIAEPRWQLRPGIHRIRASTASGATDEVTIMVDG